MWCARTSPLELPIFTGNRGGGLRRDSFYSAAWRPALRAAGLDERRYKFHSARHFAVSNMLAEGGQPCRGRGLRGRHRRDDHVHLLPLPAGVGDRGPNGRSISPSHRTLPILCATRDVDTWVRLRDCTIVPGQSGW